ncbi:MAG: MFS transporter, partial [Lentisphaerae bacterium]|nr:MFS transporter [Lentisphaerota bacterium]
AIAACGVLFGLVSLRMLRRVPGGEPVAQHTARMQGRYRLVFRDRMFMSFTGCATIFGMAYVGLSLLLTLALRDQLGIGAGTILLLTSFGNILAIATTARWRRVADRHGSPIVMAGNGLLIVGCLLALGFMQPGRAPLPILVLICALIPIAESGNYVATSRGYMLRMRPRLRHACNAVWSACTQIFGGIAAILVGFWLQSGRAIAFRTAAWGLALLMLAAIGVALYLPVPRADSARGASPVYDPARPFRSLALILRYVLRPARTRINLENGTDGSRG